MYVYAYVKQQLEHESLFKRDLIKWFNRWWIFKIMG